LKIQEVLPVVKAVGSANQIPERGIGRVTENRRRVHENNPLVPAVVRVPHELSSVGMTNQRDVEDPRVCMGLEPRSIRAHQALKLGESLIEVNEGV
jgi:hypothetical protein